MLGRLSARCGRSGWPSGWATGLCWIDDSSVELWTDLVTIVRDAPGRTLEFEVLRDGRALRFQVTPSAVDDNGRSVGRIGARSRTPDDQREQMFVTVRYGWARPCRRALARPGTPPR